MRVLGLEVPVLRLQHAHFDWNPDGSPMIKEYGPEQETVTLWKRGRRGGPEKAILLLLRI